MKKKKSENKQEEKKCSKCYGHGWWPIGVLAPIGEMDSREWPYDKIVQCPWCGKGGDNKSERYKYIKEYYDKNK